MSDDGEIRWNEEVVSEQHVLGCLMVANDRLPSVRAIVAPEHFYKKHHKQIYEAILDLYAADQPFDITTVSAELKDAGHDPSRQYLADLAMGIASTWAADYHAARVKRSWRIREAQKGAYKGVQASTIEEVLELNERFGKLAVDEDSAGIQQIGFLSEPFLEVLNSRMLGLSEDSYKCGPGAVDEITGGWFKKEFSVIAARPSMGKSAFMCTSAWRAAKSPKPKTSIIFSLEMSKEKIFERLVVLESGIDATAIRDGKLTTEEVARVTMATDAIHKLPIYIYDKPVRSLTELKVQYERIEIEAHLIWIDYIQRMVQDGTENKNNYFEDLSNGLATFAKDEDIAVIALAQLSRAVEARQNKRPKESDLRDSGGIEQAADKIGFIYREERYDPDTIHKGEAEIIIAKNRNGEIGTAYCEYRAALCMFSDLPDGYTRPTPPPAQRKPWRKGNIHIDPDSD